MSDVTPLVLSAPSSPSDPTHYPTREAWAAAGLARFGPDMLRWRFVCPVCGHVAAVADWHAAEAPESAVAYSCVGRWVRGAKEAFTTTRTGPCTYAGGGLFRLNPVTVVDGDRTYALFQFAPAEAP